MNEVIESVAIALLSTPQSEAFVLMAEATNFFITVAGNPDNNQLLPRVSPVRELEKVFDWLNALSESSM